MSKIGLITWREYSSRVKKKSFIVMTLVGPLLIALFYGIMIYVMMNENLVQDKKVVLLIDKSGMFENKIKSSDLLVFEPYDSIGDPSEDLLFNGEYDGWLEVPKDLDLHSPSGIKFKSDKNLSIQTKESISRRLERVLSNHKMGLYGVSESLIDSVRTNVQIEALVVDKDGSEKQTSTELYSIIGMVLALAIYIFIFLYGVQVMRGVIEEKTNRIVEIIVSSVKPFQLMMGKVLGIALVGLTQIVIWVLLSGVLMGVISLFIGMDGMSVNELSEAAKQLPEGTEALEMSKPEAIIQSLMNLNITFILSSFLIYFIGGYLMYSSLFAAVGAAVDAETDTQQFMLPITMPLIFAFVLASSIVFRDPNGSLSFWLSIFPLTSPVVMMVRLPFLSVPDQLWEVGLSMALLIGTFCLTIWVAGKIYRIGILMYGKKASYRELWKWIRHGS